MSNDTEMPIPVPIANSLADFTGRDWVFHQLDTWLEGGKSQIFVLTGPPGSGKSMLAARLVQMSEGKVANAAHPRLRANCVAYAHFCQARSDSTLNPLRFVETLSRQLAERYQSFALALTQMSDQNIAITATPIVGIVESGSQVIGVVIKELHIGNLSARVAFDRLLRKPLQQLCTPDFRETILILVDALDEALTYDPDDNIVTLLGYATDLPPQVRFLLTSRPDRRVLHVIGTPSLDLIDDAPDASIDLHAYAFKRLDILAEPRRETLADLVARVSLGNFLYARYVLNDLLPIVNQLEDLSSIVLPKGLDEIYRQFLKRELGRNLERWDERYGPLLGVLTVAHGQGLTRRNLAAVIGRSLSETGNILRACAQYLSGPQPDGPFHIYHQSFRDFLLADSEYQVYPTEANMAIASHFLNEYEDSWFTCEEMYALQYLPNHLVEAIQSTVSQRMRQEWMDSLRKLITDLGFLETKTAKLGVDVLRTDLRYTLSVASSLSEPQSRELALLLHVLDRNAHQLRGWSREKYPVFFAQQMHNWAVDLGLTHLIGGETTRLAQLGQPYLLLHWRSGSYSSALEYTLTGHQGTVYAVAITPDGRRAISASQDRTLKVWDLQTGLEERTLDGHLTQVFSVAMTSDGKRAISGLQDGTLRVWNLQTGREERTLSGHDGSVDAVAMTPDGLRAISGSKGMLKVWDVQTGQEDHTFRISSTRRGKAVEAVAITPDGLRAISLSDSLIVWDLQIWQEERNLGTGKDRYNVAMTSDGCRAVVSLYAGLEVWNLQTGRKERTLRGHNSVLCGLAITPDGYTAITGPAFGNNTLMVWDLQNGQERQTLSGHSSHVCALAITPDGSRAISGSEDSTLKVWNLQAGQEKQIASGHDGSVCNIAMASDAGRVVSSSWDGTLKVWNLQTGLVEHKLKNKSGPGYVAITPDGRWVLSNLPQVWDLQRGKEKDLGCPGSITSVAMTSDGRRAVFATFDGTLRVWDLQADREKQSFDIGPDEKIHNVVMTADGSRALTWWDRTNLLKVWNLQTQREEFTLSNPEGQISAVTMTPDGRRAVSASENGKLTVWDLQTQREEFTLSSPEGQISAVAMTPDGRRAVSASENGKLTVWDLQVRRELAMSAIYGRPNCVALTPDGYTILTGDGIGNIYCLHYVDPNMP